MERKNNIMILLIVSSVVVPISMMWLWLVIVVEPQIGSGQQFFMKRYEMASDKGSLLKRYDAQLSRYNGGYIPERVDAFLIDRFNEIASQEERGAIAEFHALQSHSRYSMILMSQPVSVRQEMIEILMDRLDRYDGLDLSSLLIQIESLRRGAGHFKPHIMDGFVDGVWTPTHTLRHESDDDLLEEVELAYTAWWERYTNWEERMLHSPFEGTTFGIGGP